MGAGICTMHYVGMSAIRITPAIHYDPWLVLGSIGVAVAASFAALGLAFRLRSGASWRLHLARVSAALIMGLAISGTCTTPPWLPRAFPREPSVRAAR